MAVAAAAAAANNNDDGDDINQPASKWLASAASARATRLVCQLTR